jgi:hypothetical protein
MNNYGESFCLLMVIVSGETGRTPVDHFQFLSACMSARVMPDAFKNVRVRQHG